MSLKSWVKSQLQQAPLDEVVGTRVYSLESLTSANVSGYPFLIQGLGMAMTENLAEDIDHFAERQPIRVWIHDERTPEGASYTEVNKTVRLVINALHGKSSKTEGIILVRYQNTSDELSDEALKSVYRIVTFEAVLGKVAT